MFNFSTLPVFFKRNICILFLLALISGQATELRMTSAYNVVTIHDIREILLESSGKNWTTLTLALKPFVIQRVLFA